MGRGRPRLWSGRAPRSEVLLDGFPVNTVDSSGDGSFGKKDVLEGSMGPQPSTFLPIKQKTRTCQEGRSRATPRVEASCALASPEDGKNQAELGLTCEAQEGPKS